MSSRPPRDRRAMGGGDDWDDWDDDRGSGRPNQAEIDEQYRLKDEKYAELNRLRRSIKLIKSELRTMYDVYEAMDDNNPGKAGYEQEIEGKEAERDAEQQAGDDLWNEINDIKAEIKRLKQR